MKSIIAIAGPARVMREQWRPDSDDGATFTPGHWATIEELNLEAGAETAVALDPGQSVKIWRDAE